MKLRLLAASTLAAIALTSGSVVAQDLSSEKGKVSYAVGYMMGKELAGLMASGEPLDMAAVMKAVQDAAAKKEPAVASDQLSTAFENMQRRQLARRKAAFEKLAAENKTKGDAYLAQNRAKPGVKVLPSGVQYRVIEAGNGMKPTQANMVKFDFKGSTTEGRVFADTTREFEGQPPSPMNLRVKDIPMPGLREVLLMMPLGARWEVVIPGDKAHGSTPSAGEFVNATLIFDLRLVSIEQTAQTGAATAPSALAPAGTPPGG